MPQRRFPRAARVNEVVREVVADTLERLSDPRLELVTITGVKVSPDLRHATVYYSVLERPQRRATPPMTKDVPAALRGAAPHLRTVLGRQVRLKYLPELKFEPDPAIAAGQRIEEIIRSLNTGERDAKEDT